MTIDDPTLDDVFARLDEWRHLPSYRLESRVDTFFAMYLQRVVAHHLRCEIDEFLIPEFPLRRGTLYGEDVASRNKSKKVDFVLRSACHRTIYLVELKTDQASRGQDQDDYLSRAVDAGWRALVEGVVTVTQRTKREYLPKYMHLIRNLSAMGYLEVPSVVRDPAFPTLRRGIPRHLASIVVAIPDPEPTIRVIYVQPEEREGEDCIAFERFAESVEHSGALGTLLAKYLRAWTSKAGTTPPAW